MRYGHKQIQDITIMLAKGIATFEEKEMAGLSSVILLLPEHEMPLMYPLEFVSEEDKAMQFHFIRHAYRRTECYGYGMLSEACISTREDVLPSQAPDSRPAYMLISATAINDLMIRLFDRDSSEVISDTHLTNIADVNDYDQTRLNRFEGHFSESSYQVLKKRYGHNLMPFSIEGLTLWTEKQRRHVN